MANSERKKKPRRKADDLATNPESVLNKARSTRARKQRKLDEIMGQAGHNRSGKYGK